MTTKPLIELTQANTLISRCPSCGHEGEFTLLGIQKWPPRVAQATGMPEVIGLYRCECCQTTVSEIELLKMLA